MLINQQIYLSKSNHTNVPICCHHSLGMVRRRVRSFTTCWWVQVGHRCCKLFWYSGACHVGDHHCHKFIKEPSLLSACFSLFRSSIHRIVGETMSSFRSNGKHCRSVSFCAAVFRCCRHMKRKDDGMQQNPERLAGMGTVVVGIHEHIHLGATGFHYRRGPYTCRA
jgi:hypothetical protein